MSRLGSQLKNMKFLTGTTAVPETAIIYDWENRWAIDDFQGFNQKERKYLETCESHYAPFWKRGISVDIIGMDDDFSGYKILIAPMLYMIKPGVAEHIEEFVKKGGVFVTTYLSGLVNENDLCFQGGFPGPLRNVTGIRAEEMDSLHETDRNRMVVTNNDIGLSGEYEIHTFCDLIHTEKAGVLATYKHDFYAGRPVLTSNKLGKGTCYYIAARTEEKFLDDFYGCIIKKSEININLISKLPEGVTVQSRTDGHKEFLFVLNFNDKERQVDLDEILLKDHITGNVYDGKINLSPYGYCIVERII